MKRLTRNRTVEVRTLQRDRGPEPLAPFTTSRHTLTERRQTRVGVSEAGDTGAYLSTGDGLGTFFPDKGGCIMRLPMSKVKALPRGAATAVKPKAAAPTGSDKVKRLSRRR